MKFFVQVRDESDNGGNLYGIRIMEWSGLWRVMRICHGLRPSHVSSLFFVSCWLALVASLCLCCLLLDGSSPPNLNCFLSLPLSNQFFEISPLNL